jgi:hypothetical protein
VWSFVFSRYETSFPYSNAEIHDKPLLEIAILSTHDTLEFMDKDLLVSVHLTSEVKRISNNGKIEPFIDVSPLIARGIHVTNENEILLGVRDNGDPYLTTDNSCRKIIVFDSDGNEKQSYEFDRNNQRL